MTSIIKHLKGNVIAYLALFVALGGTSYAAANLPAGSVGTKQLRNGSVTASKLARGSVSPSNLNSKAIAGHIALWAQIRANGQIVSSSPRATVVPFGVAGIERLTWKRSVSPRCFALADAVNVGPLTAEASVNTSGLLSRKATTDLVISTFSGTSPMPAPVNVVVICP